jgi:hypothetical protein
MIDMRGDLDPKVVYGVVGTLVVLVGIGIYLMLRPTGSSFELAKVAIHEPRGYARAAAAQSAAMSAAVKKGAPTTLKFAPRPPAGGPPSGG